jgi:hypothetical protein
MRLDTEPRNRRRVWAERIDPGIPSAAPRQIHCDLFVAERMFSAQTLQEALGSLY